MPTFQEDFTEAITGTGEAVTYLAKFGYGTDDLTPERALQALHAVRDMLTALRGLDSDLCASVYRQTGSTDLVLPDLGAIKVGRTANRTQWDHDDWKSAVRHGIFERHGITGDLIDSATGEVHEKYALLEEAMEVSGSAAPRLTALRALGLSPDEFCDTSPGNPSVQFKSC